MQQAKRLLIVGVLYRSIAQPDIIAPNLEPLPMLFAESSLGYVHLLVHSAGIFACLTLKNLLR